MLNIPNPGYEIEIRGRLSAADRIRVEKLLESEGAKTSGEHDRESYVFELQEGSLDLRVRKVDKRPELVLKCGRERLAIIRWKHTLRLHDEVTLGEVLDFVSYYGYTKGRIISRRYKTYAYRGCKIVLATVPQAPQYDYFEIEASTTDYAMACRFASDIEGIARELGVTPFSSPDEYRTYLKAIDKAGVDPEYRHDAARKAAV
jgi:adenylate cyclase class IV